MQVRTRELTPLLYHDFETLFAANGACGGCWCMWWRLEKGTQWNDLKGETAHLQMRELITSGRAHGILAYDGDTPIGWCSFGPRLDYVRLDRARSLECKDADKVWSLPCFFVKRAYRGRGVARTLLQAALEAMRRHGASLVEAYPVKPSANGQPMQGAFAWTGTRSLFDAAGFTVVGNPNGAKQRVRKQLP